MGKNLHMTSQADLPSMQAMVASLSVIPQPAKLPTGPNGRLARNASTILVTRHVLQLTRWVGEAFRFRSNNNAKIGSECIADL